MGNGRPKDSAKSGRAASSISITPDKPQISELFIVGSPRVDGRCARIARGLACEAAASFDNRANAVEVLTVASLRIQGCTGCDACKAVLGIDSRYQSASGEEECPADGEASGKTDCAEMPFSSAATAHDVSDACIFDDDMSNVLRAMERADALTIVSPLYFAGPPAQLKALFDRLQPHFWAGTRKAPKRPARLIVVGDGGDPFGADALVTIVRSALAVAGFRVDEVDVRIGEGA